MPADKVLVSDALLRRLCDINQFAIPNDVEMVFFGIRGATPFNPQMLDYGDVRRIFITEIDYLSFRCTIGQWRIKDKKVTIYAASTVPYITNIEKSVLKGGKGTNQMMPGYYTDFKKGTHYPRPETAHEAFKQTEVRPVRRTANDNKYDENDLITYEVQHDNIHAGFRLNLDDKIAASNGCQIVLGRPESSLTAEQGPWKTFKARGYAAEQSYFPYILLHGRDFLRVFDEPNEKYARRLRFGSSGHLVAQMQEKLKAMIDPTLTVTGIFDVPTMKAVINFQKMKKKVADGIVGRDTSNDLGISLGTG